MSTLLTLLCYSSAASGPSSWVSRGFFEIPLPLLGSMHQNISVFLLLHLAQGPRISLDVLLPTQDR